MKVKAIASQQKVRASSTKRLVKAQDREWTDKQAQALMERLLKRNKKTLDALAKL